MLAGDAGRTTHRVTAVCMLMSVTDLELRWFLSKNPSNQTSGFNPMGLSQDASFEKVTPRNRTGSPLLTRSKHVVMTPICCVTTPCSKGEKETPGKINTIRGVVRGTCHLGTYLLGRGWIALLGVEFSPKASLALCSQLSRLVQRFGHVSEVSPPFSQVPAQAPPLHQLFKQPTILTS